MDDTDLAILREMFPDRVLRWGSADLRISHAQIAEALELPKSTVTLRIRKLSMLGIFRGFMVYPNPRILGLWQFAHVVEATSASAREEIIQLLADVPGAAFVYESALELYFHVAYLGPGPEVADRGKAILSRHPGVRAIGGTYKFALPECSLIPTSLDWRIVQAVRQAPDAPLGEVAASINVSYRTFASRIDRMVKHFALLCAPRLDFTRARGTVAETEVHLKPEASLEEIWAQVDQAYRFVLRLYPWDDASGRWQYPTDDCDDPSWGPCLQFYSCHPSPGDAIRKRSIAERWPGVKRVESNFMVSMWDIPTTVDALVKTKTSEGSRSAHRSAFGRSPAAAPGRV